MDLSYILNELGEERDEYFRAVSPPIIQTSNFAFNTVDKFRASLQDEYSTWLYSRGLNPTVEILRKKLAALDAAEDCLVFNSGASAIFSSVLANVKSGDHIISVKDPYTWAQKMFNQILPRFNVSVTYIDGTNIENFENALQTNTRLIYLESPNSWSYELQDLAAVASLAKENNVITVCDNSYSTPLYQKPIQLGIDLVLQSATKYISGHSDVVAGVLSGSKQMIEKIFNSEFLNTGSGIQPFNAWLLIRGLRTLEIRLERIKQTTYTMVNWLKSQNWVDRVIFPFDESFPQIVLAKKQMKDSAGLITVVMKAQNVDEIERFCNSLKHIVMAVSWGGYESLVIPRCVAFKKEEFNKEIEAHRMLRFYFGLEDSEYLINDINSAYKISKGFI